MAGARGLLINITGGEDMTLFEVDQAANRIREEVADDANIIFGSAVDDNLAGRVRVSVVATGIDTQMPAEAARPRLVAVGGGAAVAMAQPMQMAQPMPMQPTPAVAAAPMHHAGPAVSLMGAPVLPQMAEPEPAPAPVEMARPRPAPVQMAPLPSPQPAPRPAPPARGLFTEPGSPLPSPAPAATPRNSLFGIVTGAIRGKPAAAQPVEPYRAEPALPSQMDPAPSVRPAQAEEMGLDIPAFLRRQSS